jgi:hypothetical protein
LKPLRQNSRMAPSITVLESKFLGRPTDKILPSSITLRLFFA